MANHRTWHGFPTHASCTHDVVAVPPPSGLRRVRLGRLRPTCRNTGTHGLETHVTPHFTTDAVCQASSSRNVAALFSRPGLVLMASTDWTAVSGNWARRAWRNAAQAL